jgi:hypothetical protein
VEHLWRESVAHLDEVDPASLQLVDRAARLVGGADLAHERQVERNRALQDRTRHDQVRPPRTGAVRLAAQPENLVERRRHVADGGDARRSQPAEGLFPLGEAAEVDVHVGEARDEVLTARVDHSHVRRHAGRAARADRGDAAAHDQDTSAAGGAPVASITVTCVMASDDAGCADREGTGGCEQPAARARASLASARSIIVPTVRDERLGRISPAAVVGAIEHAHRRRHRHRPVKHRGQARAK